MVAGAQAGGDILVLRFLCLLVVFGFGLEFARADCLEPDESKQPAPTVQYSNTSILQQSNAPIAKDAVKGVERRPKEDFELKLQTNAPPAAGAATNATHAAKPEFHWGFAWKGWDGLRLEISQNTP